MSVILALKSNFLTRPLVSEYCFSNSNLSVSYLVFKVNPLVSILLATNLSYAVFLATSFFTASFSLLKSTGKGSTFPISN